MDEELRKVLDDYEIRLSELEKQVKHKPQIVQKKQSVKEFVLAKNPKSDVVKALVIAYFLEKYEDMPSFNASDLENGFRTAREQIPTNINECIAKNIRKGHMMETKEKKDNLKAYMLTSSGEQFIVDNSPGK